MQPKSGQVKWSENAHIGYYAQDHEHFFDNDLTLFEWMQQWSKPTDDEQVDTRHSWSTFILRHHD